MTTRTDRKKAAIRLATTKGWVEGWQLAAKFHVHRTTIQKDLAALVEAGELVKRGRGNQTYYTLPDAKQRRVIENDRS